MPKPRYTNLEVKVSHSNAYHTSRITSTLATRSCNHRCVSSDGMNKSAPLNKRNTHTKLVPRGDKAFLTMFLLGYTSKDALSCLFISQFNLGISKTVEDVSVSILEPRD